MSLDESGYPRAEHGGAGGVDVYVDVDVDSIGPRHEHMAHVVEKVRHLELRLVRVRGASRGAHCSPWMVSPTISSLGFSVEAARSSTGKDGRQSLSVP